MSEPRNDENGSIIVSSRGPVITRVSNFASSPTSPEINVSIVPLTMPGICAVSRLSDGSGTNSATASPPGGRRNGVPGPARRRTSLDGSVETRWVSSRVSASTPTTSSIAAAAASAIVVVRRRGRVLPSRRRGGAVEQRLDRRHRGCSAVVVSL
ncbi:MAG: hypothetical protein V9G12_08020 [Microthrixaceae bacterium]